MTPTSAPLPPLSPNAWLRWDVVSAMLPPPGDLDVLEIGCGQGGFGARLSQRYSYLGVEIDEVSAEVAAARVAAVGSGGEVRHGELASVAADRLFDLVCAFEVIEHIEDDHEAIRSWVDRLRPGGLLLLSTPAWQRRYGAADEMVGHFRRYDPDVMRRLLEQARLEDVQVTHFGAPLGYLLEAARNAAGRRRLAADEAATESMADRTGASGRTLQPSRSAAAIATRVGTLPFRALQRAFPHAGPGLVARATKPR